MLAIYGGLPAINKDIDPIIKALIKVEHEFKK